MFILKCHNKCAELGLNNLCWYVPHWYNTSQIYRDAISQKHNKTEYWDYRYTTMKSQILQNFWGRTPKTHKFIRRCPKIGKNCDKNFRDFVLHNTLPQNWVFWGKHNWWGQFSQNVPSLCRRLYHTHINLSVNKRRKI